MRLTCGSPGDTVYGVSAGRGGQVAEAVAAEVGAAEAVQTVDLHHQLRPAWHGRAVSSPPVWSYARFVSCEAIGSENKQTNLYYLQVHN